jgi:hypothetical protein
VSCIACSWLAAKDDSVMPMVRLHAMNSSDAPYSALMLPKNGTLKM